MPIPDLTTAGFTAKEDSSLFEEERLDPTIRKEFEGGFTATRPRYTRTPGTKFTTGFTDITEENKSLLSAFWDTKRGGSVTFNYIHPTSGVTHVVRFAEPMKFKYVGMGSTKRWNVHGIVLETV